ncbi:MAG: hypothetical protein JXB49_18055 [Bacteroidales bacterium]|nr:hypothetical protein [Bacteroidales bacterium]
MLENLFKKIITGSSVVPPDNITESFQAMFHNALNIDWFIKDETYEAIFYFNDLEHIARFYNDGRLLDTRKNLPLDTIPEQLAKNASREGEIMNVVEIMPSDNEPYYDIVIRNKELVRFMLLMDKQGNIFEKKEL